MDITYIYMVDYGSRDNTATMGVRGEIPCIFLGRDAELAGLVAEVGNPPLPYDEIYLSREL